MIGFELHIASDDADLKQRLNAELDTVNSAATSDVAPAEELVVRLTENGELAGGVSGWTWGVAAGISMMWIRQDRRRAGLGTALITTFEREARRRGSTHVFVTSFTFQAPDFYQRLGYREIARWDDLPTPGRADVQMRKVL